MCPIRTDTPGAVAFVKDRRPDAQKVPFPRGDVGPHTCPSRGLARGRRRDFGLGFGLGGRAVGSAGAAAGDFHRG
jgi:hypothetical protein